MITSPKEIDKAVAHPIQKDITSHNFIITYCKPILWNLQFVAHRRVCNKQSCLNEHISRTDRQSSGFANSRIYLISEAIDHKSIGIIHEIFNLLHVVVFAANKAISILLSPKQIDGAVASPNSRRYHISELFNHKSGASFSVSSICCTSVCLQQTRLG
jgi:hypothetical protein